MVGWPSGLGGSLQTFLHRFDSLRDYKIGDVAQLVEHMPEEHGVVSSILTVTTDVK